MRLRTQRHRETLEVRVHPDDLGRVIGRSGRTAKSIRLVMDAISDGEPMRIDIIDTDKKRR
ncbi:KH domain RNA binding protein YlqC [Rothia mucilaginosa]|uniref:KH domain RNA binding protein YlqC n=1 Tax=Rothia mucilaginosa TaxID=43675 RepID=A0A0K2S0X3_9MICC|nr:KH domain RNA binding protein YlqC [Rothia mucilaginosa]CNI07820.1 putative RNA-binding protein (contains KH domain) [Mycobacterium tuberculosis]CNJ57934.1 putative RNA-binding protein (contains KH domain) [Mycobacterium tuberculosis]